MTRQGLISTRAVAGSSEQMITSEHAKPTAPLTAGFAVLFLSGCTLMSGGWNPAGRDIIRDPPQATHEFALPETGDSVVGQIQTVLAREDDTLSDLARRYNLGYEEIRAANPDVDPWLPGEGTEVILPTRFILPDAPREGIVLNLANMRFFYFPEPEENGTRKVITHPIGIGRVEWSTPTGSTHVTYKSTDPVWWVPASIRREHLEMGDPLPAKVLPGPENPLGKYVLGLEMEGYLIHGTNKPWGVGMRVSHGCIRLYPEDIETLFERIAVGTPVHIVDQPYLLGWLNGELYLEAHQPLEDDERDWPDRLHAALRELVGSDKHPQLDVDWEQVDALLDDGRGLPVPVSKRAGGLEQVLVAARPVANELPQGANWDGVVEFLEFPEEEIGADSDEQPPADTERELAIAD